MAKDMIYTVQEQRKVDAITHYIRMQSGITLLNRIERYICEVSNHHGLAFEASVSLLDMARADINGPDTTHVAQWMLFYADELTQRSHNRRATDSPKDPCGCADRGCPAHLGIGTCDAKATQTLYRVDMRDTSGTRFCDDCATDAMNCGAFHDGPAL